MMKAARVNDSLYEVISIAFGRASLEALVAIASCSNKCNRLVRLFIRANVHLFLPGLVKAAVNPRQKQLEAIKWLTKAAGPKAVLSLTSQLVTIPRVPAAVAQVLLDGGLCISYSQLVAAARGQIPGVEVFVRSHLSGMSSTIEAICSNSTTELKLLLPLLPPEDLPDLLHIAINALNPKAAAHLLNYLQNLPDELQQMKQRHAREQRDAPSQRRRGLMVLHQGRLQLPPPLKQLRQEHEQQELQMQEQHMQLQQQLASPNLLGELLLTAALRGHTSLVSLLLTEHGGAFNQLPEKLPVNTAEAAVQLALQRKNSAILLTLCRSKSMQQLPASSIVGLMQLTVQRQFLAAWIPLCDLAGAQQIPAKDISSLMKQAEHLQDSTAIEALAKLPNAADISSSSVAAMLEVTVCRLTSNSYNIARQLVALPASQLISSHQLAHLLHLAMERHSPIGYESTTFMLLECLTSLQGMQQLNAATLAGLCEAAVHSNSTICLRRLCTVPAAAHLPASKVAGLLRAALEMGKQTRRHELFLQAAQLTAADSITAEDLGGLLQRALQMGERASLSVVQKLCGLTTATQQLQPDLVEQLLHKALLLQQSDVAAVLCRLPAVSQLDSSSISNLLKVAVELECSEAVPSLVTTLCSQPTARDITPLQLQPVLQVAVKRRECDQVRRLCSLPAAEQLQPGSLAELIALQLETSGDCNCVLDALTELDAAQGLTAEHIAKLLASALLLGDSEGAYVAVQSLCGLPGASKMSGSAMADILRHAMQLEDEPMHDFNGVLCAAHVQHIEEICELPGAQGLAADDLGDLLQLALKLGKSSMALHLSELPAAAEISGECAANLLQQAVQFGHSHILNVLCRTVAHAVSAQQLIPCIKSALGKYSNKSALRQLLGMAAAKQQPAKLRTSCKQQ